MVVVRERERMGELVEAEHVFRLIGVKHGHKGPCTSFLTPHHWLRRVKAVFLRTFFAALPLSSLLSYFILFIDI